MIILNKFLSIFLMFILLVSCGGGGSSSDATTTANTASNVATGNTTPEENTISSYTGNRTLASVTEANQNIFVGSMLLSVTRISALIDSFLQLSLENRRTEVDDGTPTLETVIQQTVERLFRDNSDQAKARSVRESITCSGGGNATFSGNLDDTDTTGSLLIASNQCREDGVTINGSMRLTIHNYDSNLGITAFSITYIDLTLTTSVATFSPKGTVRIKTTALEQISAVSNIFVGLSTGEQILDNELTYLFSSLGVEAFGQLCEGENGCVDITTLVPFDLDDTQGELIMSGSAGSKLRLTASNGLSFIEVDADGNEIYESIVQIEN